MASALSEADGIDYTDPDEVLFPKNKLQFYWFWQFFPNLYTDHIFLYFAISTFSSNC